MTSLVLVDLILESLTLSVNAVYVSGTYHLKNWYFFSLFVLKYMTTYQPTTNLSTL
jgi:hypothetical protein